MKTKTAKRTRHYLSDPGHFELHPSGLIVGVAGCIAVTETVTHQRRLGPPREVTVLDSSDRRGAVRVVYEKATHSLPDGAPLYRVRVADAGRWWPTVADAVQVLAAERAQWQS